MTRSYKPSALQIYREARRTHAAEAHQALALLESWGDFSGRIGMDTFTSLAGRIALGRTIEDAVAREYLYRWALALRSPIFGVPHTLGL